MTDAPSDLHHAIETAERAVWAALLAGDPDADRAALAPDFLGVYPDGFAGRDAHAGQLRDGPTISAYDLRDIQIRALGPDHALIVYQARYLRPGHKAPDSMYVSSIWRRDPDGWRNVFSQDTPARSNHTLP